MNCAQSWQTLMLSERLWIWYRTHMKAEDGGGGGLRAGELARVDGVDDGARVAQLDAAAHAVAPARPPAKTWA